MTETAPDLVQQALLRWYDSHRRVLPWRALPGESSDPYGVWLSEIMLQQTTVATVKGYYERFLARWPTVEALAAAPLDDVLTEWAGLGYYARARNLHKCAQAVVEDHNGDFPGTAVGLEKLPGIGRYTSAAVAAIAFDQPAAVVDGNVERVISRLFAIEAPLPVSKPEIHAKAEQLTPKDRPGDYAQAMMDLGATICTPKSPKCLLCPLVDGCMAKAIGLENELPRKKPKKARPTRYGTAFWLEREGDGGREVLLRRRPERGLLGGMMEIPSSPWGEDETGNRLDYAPASVPWQAVSGQVVHVFTHFRLELDVVRGELHEDQVVDGQWVSLDALGGEALPTVMKKVVDLVLG